MNLRYELQKWPHLISTILEEEVEVKGGKHAEASHCQVGEEGRRRRY